MIFFYQQLVFSHWPQNLILSILHFQCLVGFLQSEIASCLCSWLCNPAGLWFSGTAAGRSVEWLATSFAEPDYWESFCLLTLYCGDPSLQRSILSHYFRSCYLLAGESASWRCSVSCVALPSCSELSIYLFLYLPVLCSGPQSCIFSQSVSLCLLGSFNPLLTVTLPHSLGGSGGCAFGAISLQLDVEPCSSSDACLRLLPFSLGDL